MRLTKVFTRFIAPIFVSFIFISSIWAQGSIVKWIKTSDSVHIDESAKTIPISNKFITVRFGIDNQRPVQVTQYEGGLVRIRKPGGHIYGFAPYISHPNEGTISIRVFRISKIIVSGKAVGESMEEIQTLITGKTGDGHFVTYSDEISSFTFQFVDVQAKAQLQGKNFTTQDFNSEWGSECCVVCDGLETCACRVITACGNCCRGACC